MSNNSFFNENELKKIGFKSFGKNVLISRNACFYGSDNMIIGDYVRIDDFCMLSGNIVLGSFIHISAYSAMYGKYGIEMKDYSGLSPRVAIFSATDDFSGEFMIGPMVNERYTKVTGGKVIINEFVQVGAGSIVFPNIKIGKGSVVGSMSLVNKNIGEWGKYAGVPVKFLKGRKKKLITLKERFLKSL